MSLILINRKSSDGNLRNLLENNQKIGKQNCEGDDKLEKSTELWWVSEDEMRACYGRFEKLFRKLIL